MTPPGWPSRRSTSTTRRPPTSASAVPSRVSTSGPTARWRCSTPTGHFLALYEQRGDDARAVAVFADPVGHGLRSPHEDPPHVTAPCRVDRRQGLARGGGGHHRRAHRHHEGAQAQPRPPRRRLPEDSCRPRSRSAGPRPSRPTPTGRTSTTTCWPPSRGRRNASCSRRSSSRATRSGSSSSERSSARPSAASRSASSTTGSRTSSSVPASCGSRHRCRCCGIPLFSGWMIFNPATLGAGPPQDPRRRRHGRVRRRVQHRHPSTPPTWRDTHLKIEGGSVWDLDNAFVDFWNLNARGLPMLKDRGSPSWDPYVRAHRNVPRQLMFPIRSDVPGGDRPRRRPHLPDGGLLHPRPRHPAGAAGSARLAVSTCGSSCPR